MSARGRVQRDLQETGAFYRASRARVPEGWPDKIQCPGCGEWQPTIEYRVMTRKASMVDLLNIVVQCPRSKCGNVFSPTAAYFESKRGE